MVQTIAERIRRDLRRQWLGASIGLLALFVALGGPAAANEAASSAAKLITGKQVKDRSLTLSDLSADTVRSLRGRTGPAGIQGAAGTDGTQGPAGPPGPSAADATPQEIVTKVLAADGTGSGVNADLLDGMNSDVFAPLAGAVIDGDAASGDLSGTYPGPQIASGAVGASEIATGAVGAAELETDSVTGADVLNSTIDEPDLNANSVTSSEIASGAVGRSELRSGGSNALLSYDPPSIAANTCVDISFNADRADPSELALIEMVGTLSAGLYLVPTLVEQTDIAWLRLCNGSGSAVDSGTFDFNFDFVGA